MVAKGISQDDFPENGVGKWSYNYTSEEPIYCFGRFSNTFVSECSLIFYRHSVVYFQEQQVLF